MDSVPKMCGCGVESVRVIKLTLKKQFNCYNINLKRATYACAALAYANSWSPFTYSFFFRYERPRPPTPLTDPQTHLSLFRIGFHSLLRRMYLQTSPFFSCELRPGIVSSGRTGPILNLT